MATCSEINCDTGFLSLEQVLLRLFAVDENGCVGIKLGWMWGTDCTDLTSLDSCGQVMTVEQALKQTIISDGCDGWALGFFFTYPDEEPEE